MKLQEILSQMSQIAEANGISTPKIVGGAAREKYLGKLKEISDIDLTTGDSTIENLVQELSIFLAKTYNFRLKKMSSGYSKLMLGNLSMDFSSHFVAPNIDQHLVKLGISNPTDMEKELFSRDFFCNALLLDTDLKTIEDITGQAIPDLKNKVIRTCLDPAITLTYNKNRVCRSIYLAAKLDFEIDPAIIDFVKKNPQTVNISSEHSLREKLGKAVNYDLKKTVHYLDLMGLWKYIPILEELRPYYEQRFGKGQ